MSRLSQTYLVDSICRLRFIKSRQKDLIGIMNDDGDENVDENGNSVERTFLSQSFHGSWGGISDR